MSRVKIVCVRRASIRYKIYDQDIIINGVFYAHCKNLGALTLFHVVRPGLRIEIDIFILNCYCMYFRYLDNFQLEI